MLFWFLFSSKSIQNILILSAAVAPFASAGICPVVNRLNQDTTVCYGLVFCLFSWPYMVKWHNGGIHVIIDSKVQWLWSPLAVFVIYTCFCWLFWTWPYTTLSNIPLIVNLQKHRINFFSQIFMNKNVRVQGVPKIICSTFVSIFHVCQINQSPLLTMVPAMFKIFTLL